MRNREVSICGRGQPVTDSLFKTEDTKMHKQCDFSVTPTDNSKEHSTVRENAAESSPTEMESSKVLSSLLFLPISLDYFRARKIFTTPLQIFIINPITEHTEL